VIRAADIFGSRGSLRRPIMVDNKSGAGANNASPYRTDAQDRELMTERALSEIRQNGSAASIAKCRAIANQIETRLGKRQPSDFLDPSAVEEVLAYLQRAAAVLKKL
jgi:hypothetical protein